MRETPEDLEQLQQVLDRSIERAGDFLRSSFQMPARSLSAAQLVRYLSGIQVVALATVTAKGEPRVAPIGSLFYRGHFYIPTVATAARTRHVMKRPAVSLTHFVGNDLAIIVHASCTGARQPSPPLTPISRRWRRFSGPAADRVCATGERASISESMRT